MSIWKIGVVLFSLVLGMGAVFAPQEGEIAEAAGLVLQSLAAEDLDDIKAETGRRLGVEVIQVRPNSPGAAAGFQEGDIIQSIGNTGVDSASKAAALLKAAGGEIACSVIAVNMTTFQPETKIRRLRLGAPSAPSPTGPPVKTQIAAPPAASTRPTAAAGADADPINAYFNLMDFACSQAWNRQVTTPAQDRLRVAASLQQGWNQMNAQAQSQVLALPRAWADLQQSWQTMSEAERNKKRAEWRDQILLPENFFAPPAQVQTFTAENNLLAFQYPASWTGGWQVLNGSPFLFIGPDGSQATWERVLNTADSPPGALFAIADIDAQMRGLSFVQAARYVIQLLMPGAASNFKEVQVTPIGQVGAIITLRGKFPGQNEERFYWIGITAFGSDKVFAGRMGGPINQAMDLLPAFHHILTTLQLHPPRPASGGGGGGSGAWEVAWSKVSTASVAYMWQK